MLSKVTKGYTKVKAPEGEFFVVYPIPCEKIVGSHPTQTQFLIVLKTEIKETMSIVLQSR
jgi:hypothetical protein